MAGESKIMLQCLDLTKQVLDSQGQVYINIRMGDFQFTFNNQDSVGIHKRKSQTQQARDNLRQQEFKQKRLKEEIEDLEKTEKDDTIEKDAIESKQENKVEDNKENEVEI